MNMIDFFDPNNPKHIEAYQYLCTNSKWPDNFIPITVDKLTTYLDIPKIQVKMADCWVNYMKEKYNN